jgi:hypothetical protein
MNTGTNATGMNAHHGDKNALGGGTYAGGGQAGGGPQAGGGNVNGMLPSNSIF